jgi:phytoene synthase
MRKQGERTSAQVEWTLQEWSALEGRTRSRALAAGSEHDAWRTLTTAARRVMRTYTTSFFIVSRFLPRGKREEVEAIYAAVRFPDEIVDTFALPNNERRDLLERWQRDYEQALICRTLKEALNEGVSCFLAAFTKVVREREIPNEYYRSFLKAMQRDINSTSYASLDELIEDYIYGSAIVVGYFLTHVYGSRTEADFKRAMASARSLAIALQLTNFLRDVSEDQRRGRVYLPLDLLREAGLDDLDVNDSRQHRAFATVVHSVAEVAQGFYALALKDVDAFNTDSQLAIHACIKVYGRLNEQILRNERSVNVRVSVPLREKFQVLPPSKYWRIPLAYFMK